VKMYVARDRGVTWSVYAIDASVGTLAQAGKSNCRNPKRKGVTYEHRMVPELWTTQE
jgi:hypothetical protein